MDSSPGPRRFNVASMVRALREQTACRKAIKYVLDRAQTDADFGYQIGPMTEAFRLLCEAEAAITGNPLAEVEKARGRSLARHPRSLTRTRTAERVGERLLELVTQLKGDEAKDPADLAFDLRHLAADLGVEPPAEGGG